MSALMVRLPCRVSREQAQLALAIGLRKKGTVSLGQAAVIAGVSKRIFIDFLGSEGEPVVNHQASELAREVSA